MIVVKHRGSFKNTEKFLGNATKFDVARILHRYGREGVAALSSATPVRTGLTANSWDYRIRIYAQAFEITWTNSNVVDGVPIAIILQYGHGTRNGGHVEGRDYINPVMRPLFDKLSNEIWQEVMAL